MSISARGLATASFISSALVFFLAIFLGSITVRSAQPNGLAQVNEPYSAFGFYGLIASGGLLLSGMTLLYASLEGHAVEQKRLLGNTLLSSGIIAVLVGGFVIWTDLQDEGPRCLNGCAASLLSYYHEVYSSMIIIIIAGLVAAVLGALHLRVNNGADNSGVSKNQKVAFPDQE